MPGKIKRTSILCILTALLFICGSLTASAESVFGVPYKGYEYDDFNESMAAPIGYTVAEFWSGAEMGLDSPLSEPQDIVYYNNDYFILDSGNSRIVCVDASFQLKQVFSEFYTESGETIDFTDAQGLAIDQQGKLYIADTENTRIVVANQNGAVEKIIERPDEALTGYDFPFRVTKVDVSNEGDIYAVADSINLGIFHFNAEGVFQKFFASNPVYQTADVIMAYLLKPFLSHEQIANRMQSTPLRVVNFCLDEMGYVYTVSQNNGAVTQDGMVRRLNYKSTDIFDQSIVFGDFEVPSDEWLVTRFVAVDVDEMGFVYLLDSARGRVFQYSKEGYLVSAFGAYGDMKGTFGEPVEVLSVGENICVLDSLKGGVHVFEPTDYAKTFRSALETLDSRDLERSLALWNEVKQQNTNSIYPYYGLGMIYDSLGDYEAAMENFRLAGAQEEYSQSFREYRKVWVGENYGWIVAVLVAVVAVFAVAFKLLKKKMVAVHGETYSPLEQKWGFPLYTLFHPVDGFEQFKFRRSLPSFRISILIVVAWFAIDSIKYFATGFAFSHVRPQDFNPVVVLISTLGLAALFAVSNWCLCTILSGRGSFKEICSVTAYSLLPYLFSLVINLVLSNVLTAQESAFLTIVSTIGLLWSACMLLGGLYSIHQFSFTKTLLSILITVIGMAVIVLLCVLFYTLLNQTYSFIYSIYLELSLR